MDESSARELGISAAGQVSGSKLRLEDVMRCPYCNYIPECNEQTCKDCEVYEDFLDDVDDFY